MDTQVTCVKIFNAIIDEIKGYMNIYFTNMHFLISANIVNSYYLNIHVI